MGYTTILFDLDHTLLDSDASEQLAFAATMREFGVDAPEQHLATYQAINGALWKSVERGVVGPNLVKTRRFEQLVDVLDLSADPTEIAERYTVALGAHGELYPGVTSMLDAVSEVAQLGLITNGIGAVQRSRIHRLKIEHYFDGVSISGEIGFAKPDPAMFEHLFEQLGGPSVSDTIIVGDSLTSDIAGGHNAGVATCWFNRHSLPSTGTPATVEVSSIAELPAALGH